MKCYLCVRKHRRRTPSDSIAERYVRPAPVPDAAAEHRAPNTAPEIAGSKPGDIAARVTRHARLHRVLHRPPGVHHERSLALAEGWHRGIGSRVTPGQEVTQAVIASIAGMEAPRDVDIRAPQRSRKGTGHAARRLATQGNLVPPAVRRVRPGGR